MLIPLYKKREILFHAVFWAVYISFTINHISSFQNTPQIHWGRVLSGTLISVLYVFTLSYLNYFYFIPIFLIRKKIAWFAAAFGGTFILMTFFRYEIERLAFGGASKDLHNMLSPLLIAQVLISNLFIVLFIGLVRFASDWLELDSLRRELEKEKLNAELNFLKAQVNPHFFFNTLNNLYYLATIKSDNAPLVISKLSEVMRYMIYEASQEKVVLDKEIEYMQHYISLEQLRLKEGMLLDFEVSGKTNILITPLILITFLENAFKHGASKGGDQSWVRARLEVDESRLVYRIGNSKPTRGKGLSETGGIGLQNVQRRLALSYPGKYILEIDDQESSFFVALTIDLP
jgi:two-component system, LytTR family, sensor histidine kinase AlgZ